MAIANQFINVSIEFLNQDTAAEVSAVEFTSPLFEGAAIYTEPIATPSGCEFSEECDCPVTHYDADGQGYCDFHWEDWD